MKNTIKTILSLVLFCLPFRAFAYTLSDVGEHNTPSDCWVIFEDGIYDLSRYIPLHDRYMDIRGWCGKDMTSGFKNKAGLGRDHRSSSYALLEQYNIGELDTEDVVEEKEITISSTEEVYERTEDTTKSKEYTLLLPLLFSLIGYWIPYFMIKRQTIKLPLSKFNGFWNTVLMLTLLIPSFGFDVFMMIRTNNPKLYDVNFDFMYWHVELSVVMGVIAISHFLQRYRVYKSQLKKSK